MRMELRLVLAGAVLSILMVGGCRAPQKKAEIVDYGRPLPPGELALRKITDSAMMPDLTFACYETLELRSAITNSLNYLNKQTSKRFYPYGNITHAHAAASLEAFGQMLDSGLYGRDLAREIQSRFDIYISVGCDNRGTVLFTGYYTPIFDGSLERTGRFQYPLYKQPADLVKGDDGAILGRREADGTYTPYASRAQLENSGQLKGLELAWLGDPFEVYVAQVQGSAKIRLANGELVTVGYAANNGHEYRSVGQELIRDGKISSGGLSLKAMIDYFKAHPQEVDSYILRNPRYVFFQKSAGAPHGSLNEPVTTMRTIATDKSIYPRGCLAFFSTRLPGAGGSYISQREFTGFVLDQDTGGAIRAPGRCDIYMGEGDLAGDRAGHTYQEGKLYYLFLKSSDTTSPGGMPTGS